MPKGYNYNRKIRKKFICKICKNSFYHNPQSQPKYCKECRKIAYNKLVKNWRLKNKEKHILNQRLWSENNRENLRKHIKKYEENNREKRRKKEENYRNKYPEKQIAHKLCMNIKKKSECEKCKSTERLERHHEDYSKPKEFKTLCKKCHSKEHRKYKLNEENKEK